MPISGQNHLRSDDAFELLVDANLFVFQGAAGITVRITLPFRSMPQYKPFFDLDT
jgi:hypothetical protein